ncbi:MAG: MBOAT family protein [Planctomycetes bacterium]|nr:MBOAT family protein [Planctomycetota bacterium]
MLFHSLDFLWFFVIVFAVYWRLGHVAQNWLLVAASMVFYGSWNWQLLGLIVFSASVDFFCGRGIGDTDDRRTQRRWVALSVVSNLGLLAYFKYAGFFVDSFVDLAGALGYELPRVTLDIILPVGISFYSFQSMSYTIDVYRGDLQPTRSYRDFLLYVSFFPQLVAGPIERGRRFLPQVEHARPPLNLASMLEATKLIAIGFLQKVAIADALAPTVDQIFSQPQNVRALPLLFGVYAFAIQIYCDFSGYSKIARGTAQLLGFKLMLNFDEPYLARNITEFWRRWHISLSTWLRDYLYIPLGGNRKGRARTYVNLMLTMLIGGLWHGAAWTFVVWGGLHGLYLAVHKMLHSRRGSSSHLVVRVASIVVTFHLVGLTWIFFRAASFDAAWTYLTGMFTIHGWDAWSVDVVEVAGYALLSMSVDVLLVRRKSRTNRILHLFSRRWWLETIAITALVLFVLLVGENQVVPFVYFQF